MELPAFVKEELEREKQEGKYSGAVVLETDEGKFTLVPEGTKLPISIQVSLPIEYIKQGDNPLYLYYNGEAEEIPMPRELYNPNTGALQLDITVKIDEGLRYSGIMLRVEDNVISVPLKKSELDLASVAYLALMEHREMAQDQTMDLVQVMAETMYVISKVVEQMKDKIDRADRETLANGLESMGELRTSMRARRQIIELINYTQELLVEVKLKEKGRGND